MSDLAKTEQRPAMVAWRWAAVLRRASSPTPRSSRRACCSRHGRAPRRARAEPDAWATGRRLAEELSDHTPVVRAVLGVTGEREVSLAVEQDSLGIDGAEGECDRARGG